ncbi:MAG TPA: helix-turn-helix domain-containing protein [Ktedonobacteraceae bacterium]|nr:helix-turn-helix domain-containing protein [Ktedonobacteraceae bacterium]
MRKAYKFRLYPNKQQEEKPFWTLNRCRELNNAALSERKDAYCTAVNAGVNSTGIPTPPGIFSKNMPGQEVSHRRTRVGSLSKPLPSRNGVLH